MQLVTINTNHVGLVFRKGELVDVLQAGRHWLGWGREMELYNMSLPFKPAQELDVLLQHTGLAANLNVLEVQDNEVAILYRDGRFKEVLSAGKYAFWKGVVPYTWVKAGLNDIEIGEEIDRNLLMKGVLGAYIRVFKVDNYEKGVLFVDGKMNGTLEPGLYFYWKNSVEVQVYKTDIRQMSIDVPGQEILTRDKAQLRLNFTAQYQVKDVVKALVENKEFDKQLYIILQLVVRAYVGRLSFDELMDQKDRLGEQVKAEAVAMIRKLGVELLHVGVKDIILPGDIREIMNQVLIAEKRAQANIITRREETASTRSLLNTAKLMEENAMLLKLKEMEYVEKIAENIQSISVSGGSQIVDQLRQLFVK